MAPLRDNRPPFAGLAGYDLEKLAAALPSPCYLLDEARLRHNGEILKGVQERTGCKILLAQKAFSNFDLYPVLAPYLAGTEASGTGNMKLMANGAVTLGTLDGANVEIADLVGRDNIYLFGRSSQEVIDLYQRNAYRSSDYWQRGDIGYLVDFLLSPELLALGDPQCLARLYKDFIAKDYFMALLDLRDYIDTKERCLSDYEVRTAWSKKMLVNIAQSGYFSSDRTIAEYNRDIWHL